MMKLIALTLLGIALSIPRVTLAQEVENFTLEAVVTDSQTQGDSKFELAKNKGKTIVLHFLLKTECPFCLKYTQEYAKLAATTPDVVHLFIKPDSEKDIRAWAKKIVKIEGVKQPTIYRDAGAKIAKRFGIPDGYQFHGQSVHYPALIVLDGQGKEMFRHVGKSNSDRMPKDQFVKKLESMTKK
ncbi:TlpA family protein disulfide reductase [Pirellulaceae bacterium SH467]